MNTQRQRDSQPSRSQRRTLLRYSGMGVELASAIIGLTLLGLWIDYKFDTRPVGVLVGAGVGIVGGFYNFIRAAQRMSREERAQTRQDQAQDNDD